MASDRDNPTTVRLARALETGQPRRSLRIFGQGIFATYPLPSTGTVSIGRSADCDVVVNDRSISRQHAVLRVGAELSVEDAGSANGTRIGARDLVAGQPARLQPGEIVQLGALFAAVELVHASGPAAGTRTDAGAAGLDDGDVVVLDEAMQAVHRALERVASGTINVLLTGETGVGKEVLAELVHRRSPRAAQPFLRLNCATLSEAIVESELFGHEKGAFTGALHAKPGLFESADGGTVFLDEIGELPLELQAKLLRVIEDRHVWRVGALKPRPIDVRFISATNRVLEHEIANGRFRQDLYFRLNGMVVKVPPLRERRREIASLAQLFVRKTSAALGVGECPRLTSETLALFEQYAWPGNVRELRNAIERAVLLSGELEIRPEHLPFGPTTELPALSSRRDDPERTDRHPPVALHDQIDELERQGILDALAACGGNQSAAARRLGISRSTLIARLDRYGVPRPRK
jgi:transcriptional regulator with PAS, ATPase and Fis domain